MSLKTRMAEQSAANNVRSNMEESLYKNERTYRLNKRVDAWAKIPEIN